MGDMESRLSAEDMAELAALADGTLPRERRAAVEARVAGSPELRELLDRQRRAVTAMQAVASEPAPASLRTAVADRVRELERGRVRAPRLIPRFAWGGAAAAMAAVAVALVLVLGGGAGGPTVADAAQLAARPPAGPAPARQDSSRAKLAASVEGVVFPDLRRSFGWRAIGIRHGEIDGRDTTTVYYASGGRRIAYVIVSGSGLDRPSGAETTTHGGVAYQALGVNGHPVVTWRRLGHTCVLTGSTSRAELLKLASWRGGGSLRY